MFRPILFSILLAAGSALAWDPIGHMLVNQIAYDHLTPEAKSRVDAETKLFNEKEGADYDFVTLGCWMDDIRSRTRDYNPWHYVNLPFTPDGRPIPGKEGGANVILGGERALRVLRGEAQDDQVPPVDALAIFSHLVGDSHQPLHSTSRSDDAGGNKVQIANLRDPESDLLFSHGGNLHFFWDSAYRRVFKDGKADVLFFGPLYPRDQPVEGHKAALGLVRREADAIEKEYPPSILKNTGTPQDWAAESHAAGYSFGYGKLPETDGLPVELDDAYVAGARSIARERIALAGYRLAALLNEIFANGSKK